MKLYGTIVLSAVLLLMLTLAVHRVRIRKTVETSLVELALGCIFPPIFWWRNLLRFARTHLGASDTGGYGWTVFFILWLWAPVDSLLAGLAGRNFCLWFLALSYVYLLPIVEIILCVNRFHNTRMRALLIIGAAVVVTSWYAFVLSHVALLISS